MSKLKEVKAYIEAGHRNSDICKMLDVAPAYVSTVRFRMNSGTYDKGKASDPKCADGDQYRDHYAEIQRRKQAEKAKNKYCQRMKVVRGKAMECGNPSHGRTYCASCREELLEKSRRRPEPVMMRGEEHV